MSYNYSEAFLTYHSDVVDQLKDAFDRDLVLEWVYKRPEELQRQRHKVGNVLRSMVLYWPELLVIRKTFRSWTVYDRDNGNWHLYLGRPRGKMVGRPPGDFEMGRTASSFAPAAISSLMRLPKPVVVGDDSWSLLLAAFESLASDKSVSALVAPITEEFQTSEYGFDAETIAALAGNHNLRTEKLGPDQFQFSRREV